MMSSERKNDMKASIALMGLAAVLVATVCVVALIFVRTIYNNAVDEGKAEAQRFIGGAKDAVGRSVLGVDMLLASMTRLLDLERTRLAILDVQHANQLIASAAYQNLLIRNVAVLDTDGNTLVSSDPQGMGTTTVLPPGFAEQVRKQPVSTMLISAPTTTSAGGPALFFARYARVADGSKWLVVAEIKLSILNTILGQGANSAHLEATMELADGTLLASSPGQPALAAAAQEVPPPIALNYADEVYEPQQPPQFMPGRLSGRSALVAARGMLYDDVILTVSIPMDNVLNQWYEQRRLVSATAAVFIAIILSATAVRLTHLRRRAQAQRTLVEAKAALDQALESMENGFLLLDAELQVVRWNRRYLELFPWHAQSIGPGCPVQTLLASTAHACSIGDTEAERKTWLAQRLERFKKPPTTTHELQLPEGILVEVTERRTADDGLVILFQDVTALRHASAEIAQLAYFDSLTGLPNRRLLGDRLTQAINVCTRSNHLGALLFLDLDHFKTLNDTMGHDLGDALLLQVAQRLKACVREADTVARLGGDEFVVMLQNLGTSEVNARQQTNLVGHKILQSLDQPYELRGVVHRSSCSIGATLFADSDVSAADLLKQADIAMYQAKAGGRNALCFFDTQMLDLIQGRADLERDLRHALVHQQFELLYQLQATSHGAAVGAEVLVRWQHPVRGCLSPLEFIAMAEETSLILPLGDWVLHTACQQLKRWERHPAYAQLQLAVNVSARQFHQTDFVARVSAILRGTAIDPTLLKLELTESLVLNDVPDTIAKMHRLKALGVRFSMDDFGTGQSSLSYLTRLPLDQLKIDKSFVQNIGSHKTDATIVQTIIGMGTNLGLEVIAEGVETPEQRDFLQAHGCHVYQGYLFSRPIEVTAFEALVQSMARLTPLAAKPGNMA